MCKRPVSWLTGRLHLVSQQSWMTPIRQVTFAPHHLSDWITPHDQSTRRLTPGSEWMNTR